MLIDIETRQPVLANGTGGLSGPAVKPIALHMVYEVARELRSSHPHVPIIGIGGIKNTKDAVQFIIAGDSAVQNWTVHFFNPHAGGVIIVGSQEVLTGEGV